MKDAIAFLDLDGIRDISAEVLDENGRLREELMASCREDLEQVGGMLAK